MTTKPREQEFTEWFAKNYPGPDTIIHDPYWHAPKIFRKANEAPAQTDVGLINELGDCVAELNHAMLKLKDCLDNRRINLRICDAKDSCRNRTMENRKIRLPKNISFSKGLYFVRFKDEGVLLIRKSFTELDDAVIFRDDWMRKNNWNMNFGSFQQALKQMGEK